MVRSAKDQYSKIGNTREQLFHAWRSFNFEENVETIDAYIHCIRQVATPLGYQEPHILGVRNIKVINFVIFLSLLLQDQVYNPPLTGLFFVYPSRERHSQIDHLA